MAVDQKELLQRASIRTMKKDLKRLREADAKKESQRITSARMPETLRQAQGKPSMEIPKPAAPPAPPPPLHPDMNVQTQSERRITDLKHAANESEKQEIFLLESRRKALAQKLADLAKGEEASLMTEKSKAIAERDGMKERMDQLSQKAQGKGDKMAEQQAWFLAQELKKADSAIQIINEHVDSVKRQKGAFQLEIQGIDSALRSIADGLETRKTAPPAEPFTMKEVPFSKMPQPKAPEPSSHKAPEKSYLKEVPARVKEKLSQSTAVEEEARRKFMEDVEQWAAAYEKSRAGHHSGNAKKEAASHGS